MTKPLRGPIAREEVLAANQALAAGEIVRVRRQGTRVPVQRGPRAVEIRIIGGLVFAKLFHSPAQLVEIEAVAVVPPAVGGFR